MTTAQHGGAGTQRGEPSGAQPSGDPFVPPAAPPGTQTPGDLPAPPAAPAGQGWGYAPSPPRRSQAMAVAVAAAILLATAALVVSIVGVTHSSTPSASPAPSPAAPAPTSAAADVTAANRALCTAIAPLMTEDNRVAKTFSNLGPAGSPAWNAGVPKFISDTKDWVGRIQPVIDSHQSVDPYLLRSLQRLVDDQRNLVADLEAGPWQHYDQTIWDDSLGAYNGPQSICWDLGIKW